MRLNRRDLLKGIGAGTVLLSPFARMVEAMAQGAKPGGNFLFFFTPNGFVRSNHGSSGDGEAFTLRKALAACEPYKAKMSTVKGLCNKSTTAKSSHEEITRLLTCTAGSSMYQGYSPSIDQVVAAHLGGKPLTLGAVAQAPDWNTKLSYEKSQTLNAHEYDAKKVFDSVFGAGIPAMTGGGTTAPAPNPADDLRRKQDLRVADFLKKDLTLFKSRLGKAEQARLDTHIDAINDLQKRINATAGGGAAGPIVKAASCDKAAIDALNKAATAGGNGAADIKARGERMMELVAASFACGLRRSASILMEKASAGHNPLTGAGAPYHHNASHGNVANAKQVWMDIDGFYGGRFAYLLGQLEKFGVLDNTMVVWGSEISEQHNQNNMLFIIAGGGNLGVQYRKSIVLPFTGNEEGDLPVAKDPKNTSLANLWVTVQKVFGVPSDKFGDSSTGFIPDLIKT